MDDQKLVDSVKFLLKSVRQLSDHFVETNDNISRSFESVRQDVSDLSDRLEKIEQDLQNWRDQELIGADGPRREPELPVRGDSAEALIPALNLPLVGLLDVYRNNPALLQPFARPCSLSGRTLSGAIAEIELEVFAQGTTWMVETQDGSWVLLPRPGMLLRRTQVESLGRLFDLACEAPLPAEMELLSAGTATVVEHGRRWYLKDKGTIGLVADPLQHSLENRLRALEQRLMALD